MNIVGARGATLRAMDRASSTGALSPPTDEEVVARVLAGDRMLFELLMRRHNQRLFRIARAIVRDDAEAEDIVQEAYVRAYAALAKFEGRASVATWLSRIALHEALRRRRRLRRQVTAGPMNEAPDPVEEPSAGSARAEARALLGEAIDALPARLRAVVMLRLVEGLAVRETAECLHMSEANVKVSLHRARRMLAETIERRVAPEWRRQFSFDGARCDRIVANVLARLP